LSATAEHYTDEQRAYLALGHLSDISTALHSISYELEQIRHALTTPEERTSQASQNVATYTPIHTAWGEMSFAEWSHGGHR
jgi:hypothetical protein